MIFELQRPLTLCGFAVRNKGTGRETVIFDHICLKRHNLTEPKKITPGAYEFSLKVNYPSIPFMANKVEAEITVRSLDDLVTHKAESFELDPGKWSDWRPLAELEEGIYFVQIAVELNRLTYTDHAVLSCVLDTRIKREQKGKVL
ncbi:MAG: hypothetical protein H0Z24_10390 [Thermosipho sp. (in: Bacteria)]|nr:hypothetical protein [Thermosipho sp. (in: thermotogales)]